MKYDPSKFYPMAGYEKIYEINTHGEIRRINDKHVMRQTISNRYKIVYLYNGKKYKPTRVHTLVGKTFIGPLKPKYGFIHKNYDTLDNRLENLEMKSLSDIFKEIGMRGTRARSVDLIDENGNVIDSFKSAKAASRALYLSMPQVLARLNKKLKNNKPPYIKWTETRGPGVTARKGLSHK